MNKLTLYSLLLKAKTAINVLQNLFLAYWGEGALRSLPPRYGGA
jgi:hypothetical protein